MFVELLGLPASGKSTLFKACRANLQALGCKVGSAAELDSLDTQMPGYFRRNPVTRALYRNEQMRAEFPACIQLIEQIASENINARALLYSSLVRQLIYRENPEVLDVAVIDEGGLHRTIHLLVNNAPEPDELLDTYCDVAPHPDVVIYLKLDPSISHDRAFARLAQRNSGKRPITHLKRRLNSAHGGIETLQKRAALMERAVERVSTNGCHVIRVDATDDPEKIGTSVADALREFHSTKGDRE